jgi:hypothetical protein
MNKAYVNNKRASALMTGILTIHHIRARARLAAFFAGGLIAAGPAFPVLADAAPRDALPSREAIGWLLETEPTGSAAPWTNSRSGYSGSVTVTQTWYRADGTPCREYVVAVMASGPQMTIREKTIKGTGCRVASGEWNLNEDAPALVGVVALSPPSKKPPEPDALSPDALSPDARSPDALSPTAPEAVTAVPPPAPFDTQAKAPAPPPGTPGGVSFTAADFIPATAEHKPVAIPANLPSRSDG